MYIQKGTREFTLANLALFAAGFITFANLFLSWWLCRDYYKEPNASAAELEELKRCIDDGSAEIATFYDYLHTIMRTTFSEQALQHPEQPSQAEIIEISDDDDKLPAKPPRRRKTNLDKHGSKRKTPVTVTT